MKKLLFSTLGIVMAICLVLTMSTVANPGLGIVGLWHFDEIFTDGQGVQTTPDSSGQGNTGTLMPLGSEAPLAPGKLNSALSFNGINQWVDCGATVDDSITTELTLAAWIKDDGISSNHLFIISNDYTHGTWKGYDFFLWHDGCLYADVGTGVLGRVSYLMPVDTLWHHVAVTWDGTTVTLYVDGNSVGTTPLSGTYNDPGKNTYVGKFNWPVNYNPHGKIDEVRIYNRVLSDDEIAALASTTITVEIDIKPGNDLNNINLSSAGIVSVAILSSDTFDATTVDPATVFLAGAEVKMAGKSGKYLYHIEDVNGDELPDLVCQVYTAMFMIEPGDAEAELTAETFDGQRIFGVDTISIVPR